MKNVLNGLLVVGLLLSAGIQPGYGESKEELQGTITLSGAWALYPMAVKWAEEFQKIRPKVKIDVAAGGAGKGMADALASVADIGMVSRVIYPAEIEKGAWWVSVTKDAVVPTINENNPVSKDLLSKGVKKATFIDIWITEKVKDWKGVAPATERIFGKTDLHVYTRSDACGAADTWADFLGKKQEDLLGVGVYGDPGLAEAVRQDILGIGFNNISYVYDAKTKKQVKGIRVLPIDLNGNGQIDKGSVARNEMLAIFGEKDSLWKEFFVNPDEDNVRFKPNVTDRIEVKIADTAKAEKVLAILKQFQDKNEDFYDSRDEIVEAIATGRYPSPPARDLHFVSQGRPKRKVVIEFVRWVLTDGQKYVPEAGYINLTEKKLHDGLKKLEGE